MAQNSRAQRSIIYFVAILGSILHLTATTPVLEWDPNTEPFVAGYKFYSGEQSRSYTRVVDVGRQTSIALTNLDPGITYYFAITAYATNLVESAFSEEISYTSHIDGITAAAPPCRLRITDGTARIAFYSRAGRQCWIEASSDFKTWERIDSGFITMDGMVEVSDPGAPNRPMRFYRAVVSPP